jgi:hypothetical protein
VSNYIVRILSEISGIASLPVETLAPRTDRRLAAYPRGVEPDDDRVSFRTDDQPEVEILWEGAEWRKVDGRWVGTVRFHVKPGENRIDAFDQDLIRPAEQLEQG